MTEIRHIVFDIGRVLIHYDPELAFRDIIPDAGERARFLDEVCTSAWNGEQDRGRSWQDAEAELIALHPDREREIRAFRKGWREMVPHALHETVALMERFIDEGRDVTMLTNFAPDTFAEALEIFPFLQKPRGVTVSGRIGLIKPDRAIYDHHAQSFGLEPSATLFIDDSAANVEAAHQVGWHAVQYVGHDRLVADLNRFRLV
jgi:2-haloacid dehalogenase